jgi:hypothetical protein
MGQEVLAYSKNGEKIKEPFSNMWLRSLIGMFRASTWTGRKMKRITNQGISVSLTEKQIPATDAARPISSIRERLSPSPNSGKHICLIGQAITHLRTTLTKVDLRNGWWRSTTKVENVFDLLNCGPNNRFTVVTPYGPVIVHNCVQAFSRDIFKYGQINAEKEGYSVVLPVHDELVTEVPDTPEYSAKRLEEIMATNPPWAQGLPLAAEGFEDYRYHK